MTEIVCPDCHYAIPNCTSCGVPTCDNCDKPLSNVDPKQIVCRVDFHYCSEECLAKLEAE